MLARSERVCFWQVDAEQVEEKLEDRLQQLGARPCSPAPLRNHQLRSEKIEAHQGMLPSTWLVSV